MGVCPTEPVLGALPSKTAAAEGLAKAQLLFLLKPQASSIWHLRVQVASPECWSEALASPALQKGRCGRVAVGGFQCVPPPPVCNGCSS